MVYSPSAQRDLANLPVKIVDAVIAFCEGPLAKNPQRVGKPLQNQLVGLYTARRGAYRIIYRIEEEQIIVVVTRIDHRAHVYR